MQLRLPTLSPRNVKILRLAGYPVFYLFCLLLFARLTFPYDRVKDRIIAEFDARQKGPTPKRLEIEDVSGHWLFGVEAEGVKLVSPPPRAPVASAGDADAKPPPPKVLDIDSLHGSVSLLRLLFGTVAVDFGAELGDGQLDGSFVKGGDESVLELDIQDVSVAGLAPLEELVELPLLGVLGGHVEFTMPEGELSKADGTIELHIDDLQVGDGKAKIRNTIALPKLRAGNLKLAAEATSGKLDVGNLSANGPDFQLTSAGSLRLRDPFNASIADLRFNFKFKDSYKNKSDITRGLFGAPNSNVPGLFDLDPKIKRAKGADGFYSWRVTGPVAKLNFLPAADSATRRGASSLRRTSGSKLRNKTRKPKKD